MQICIQIGHFQGLEKRIFFSQVYLLLIIYSYITTGGIHRSHSWMTTNYYSTSFYQFNCHWTNNDQFSHWARGIASPLGQRDWRWFDETRVYSQLVASPLPCKAKKQYLLTLQVSTYRLLGLQSSIFDEPSTSYWHCTTSSCIYFCDRKHSTTWILWNKRHSSKCVFNETLVNRFKRGFGLV